MLEMNIIKYNSHNSVWSPFWGNFFKMLFLSGGPLLSDFMGGQKINVTFKGALLSEFYGMALGKCSFDVSK